MVCLVSYCDRNKQEARSGCMKWVHPSTHLLAPTGLSGTGKIECKEQSHSRSPRKRKQLRQRLWSVHNELASSPAHFGRHLMGKWRPEVGWDYIRVGCQSDKMASWFLLGVGLFIAFYSGSNGENCSLALAALQSNAVDTTVDFSDGDF